MDRPEDQRVFQGSQGVGLIRLSPCSTGTNLTPTVTGVFSVIYKTYRWRFSDVIDGQYRRCVTGCTTSPASGAEQAFTPGPTGQLDSPAGWDHGDPLFSRLRPDV
ncbi:MAG: L,D-transpeptidase [Oscillospiraceae bacterium]